jgi:hypothetical protein
MSDFTQAQTTVLAQQALVNVAGCAMLVGGSIDVRTYLSGVVYIYRGNTEAVANLVAGLAFIELQKSADGVNWSSVAGARFIPTGGTPITLAADAVCAASQALITTGTVDTALWLAGKWVFMTDATDEAANSEWHMIKSSDTTGDESVTFCDNLAFAKASGDDIYDLADVWPVGMDFAGVGYIRVVACNGGASGPDWVLKAILLSATDLE